MVDVDGDEGVKLYREPAMEVDTCVLMSLETS